MAIDGQTTAALEHRAEARLAEGGVANAPAAGAADAPREHRTRLKQRDDFREWVVHAWTLTNGIRTPHGGVVRRTMRRDRLSTMKTVLITGCSSGYGLETARHFHAQGWNVIATMRNPREDVLPRSERLVWCRST